MQLKDRVAIVTGAGQGIGTAVAAAYAREGARVAVVDMNIESAQGVAAEINAAGGQAIAVACNVAVREQVFAMAAQVTQTWGRVDILVNNAGITRTAMLHKMTQEQWQDVLAVHLSGSFNCLQAVVDGMIERRYGRIIYVTSAAGILGTIGQINYSAAKAGLLGLTKSSAKELARFNITANAIAPGAATPMTETIRTDERFKEKYLDRIPLGRWAEPKEIAPVFVFFASDASSYVTGQILAADGGMTIH
ncbi:3-oxoacyl-ACP reductase FabG [Polaromonas sp.]|uniref:3-oxoacyl-ACP reductase FabG n=1 Tax=Polaromonas sp. TaxID=1869339 RepID=UPI0018269A6B|nr:3-oxoacyl-ACP reductase FabG [Polaromonas sp.]NMM05633.1 3-oxoacyl-ACP reductase FabG [Polaromonas sp.]